MTMVEEDNQSNQWLLKATLFPRLTHRSIKCGYVDDGIWAK